MIRSRYHPPVIQDGVNIPRERPDLELQPSTSMDGLLRLPCTRICPDVAGGGVVGRDGILESAEAFPER